MNKAPDLGVQRQREFVKAKALIVRSDLPDMVQYTFPAGFTITATSNGVSFGGSSTVLDEAALKSVQQHIRWAATISKNFLNGHGAPLQEELTRDLKLQIRYNSTDIIAWFEGDRANGVIRQTAAAAVRELRAQARRRLAAREG